MTGIRVAVDATPLLLRSAGVKTYVHHWTRHLIETAGRNRISLYPFLDGRLRLDHENSALGRIPTLARLAWLHAANLLGPAVLDLLGPSADLFHASHQLRFPPRKCRLTSTIYDMTCWVTPQFHTPANVKATRLIAGRVFQRAHGLIAISESARADAIRILGLSPERITVIYPGVAGAFFDAPRTVSASKPYVLFVGTIEPRKNVVTLLEAWEQMSPDTRAAFDLVIAGPAGWGDRAVLDRLRSGARYLGYVPEAALPGLTAGAAVFVYPSLYEGFGLPVAQAMAAGVPVVTSSVSSLPEITNGAALLVDPRSASGIRAALEKLLRSESLRAELAAKGRGRAAAFRWETAARQTWEFFERVCGQ